MSDGFQSDLKWRIEPLALLVDLVFVRIDQVRIRMRVQFHRYHVKSMSRNYVVVIHQNDEFARGQL